MDTLEEILDLLYSYRSDCDELHISIGIWNASETPYTYFATLNDADNVTVTGEGSLGSDSLQEALEALLTDVEGLVKE